MSETYETLVKQLLAQETDERMLQAKIKLIERIAAETEVKPSRIPAALNITEVGGYYNLLAKLEKEKTEMRMKMIASALGLPVR